MVPIKQLSFLCPPLREGQRPNFASKHPSCSFRHSVSCSETLWQSGYYLILGSKPATTSPTNYKPIQRTTISVLRDGALLTTGLSKLHIHNRLNSVLCWELTTGHWPSNSLWCHKSCSYARVFHSDFQRAQRQFNSSSRWMWNSPLVCTSFWTVKQKHPVLGARKKTHFWL